MLTRAWPRASRPCSPALPIDAFIKVPYLLTHGLHEPFAGYLPKLHVLADTAL